jgi:hypothetical protein
LGLVEDYDVLGRRAGILGRVFPEVAKQSLKRALQSSASAIAIWASARVGDECASQYLNERPVPRKHDRWFPGDAPRTILEHEIET